MRPHDPVPWETLRELRLAQGLSLRAVCERIHDMGGRMTPIQLSRLERGRRPQTEAQTLGYLVQALGCGWEALEQRTPDNANDWREWRHEMRSHAWNVYRWTQPAQRQGSRELLDTVFFDSDMNARTVHESLVNHDGYPSDCEVELEETTLYAPAYDATVFEFRRNGWDPT